MEILGDALHIFIFERILHEKPINVNIRRAFPLAQMQKFENYIESYRNVTQFRQAGI